MDKLALHGGSQACPPGTIPVWPLHDESEEAGVLRVLRSGKWWRIPGSEVDCFEQAFAAFHDVSHSLAVTNGTQALELALASMGVGFGDEVIVPAFTFASTVTSVLYAGATPVTVDVGLDSYCMDAVAFERAITPRTKVVIPVHLAGQPCDMDAIIAIARQHGIKILADAAHAHGARWRGQSVARLADAAIYSFQAGKLMTAGEGGAVVTNDDALAKTMWLKNSCGRPRNDKMYEHATLGTNMRMSELQGAVLRAQLARFPQQLEERERARVRLDRAMSDLPALRPQRRIDGASLHSHYMYMVHVDAEAAGLSRDELVAALVAEGVPAFRSYKAIPELDMFIHGRLWSGDVPPSLRPEAVREALERNPTPSARRLARESLWLHHAVLLGGERVQLAVAEAFQKCLRSAERERPTKRATADVATTA